MRNKTIAAILGLVFGMMGIHWFYLGKKVAGILSICFFWVFGIPGLISMIHAISLLLMSQDDFDNRYNDGKCSDIATLLSRTSIDLKDDISRVSTREMPDF